MWIGIAFFFLGFLIGNLSGFSIDSVTGSLITLLFAFGGGSAIALVQKLDEKGRNLAGKTIIALSVGCLMGIYFSLFIAERQLLTPQSYRESPEISTIESRKVLRSNAKDFATILDQQYKGTDMSAEEAYEKLYDYVVNQESNEKNNK